MACVMLDSRRLDDDREPDHEATWPNCPHRADPPHWRRGRLRWRAGEDGLIETGPDEVEGWIFENQTDQPIRLSTVRTTGGEEAVFLELSPFDGDIAQLPENPLQLDTDRCPTDRRHPRLGRSSDRSPQRGTRS